MVMLGTTTALAADDDHNLFPGEVYVTLQDTGAVEALDSGQVWKDLPNAHYDAISPDGKRLLVSDADQPRAYLVDTDNGKKLASFDIGPTPQGVAIGPDGKYGLAVSAEDGTVSVIDIDKEEKIKTIEVGDGPHNAVFTQDGKTAYVTLQNGGGVAIVDMDKLEKSDEFPVPDIKPHNLALSEDEETLWIRGFEGHAAAVDTASQKVLKTVEVGLGHAGIDVDAKGRAYTGAIADDVVDVIDPDSHEVIKKIKVGEGPHGVRASKDGKYIYVGLTGDDQVVVIDTDKMEVVKKIDTEGEMPFFISAEDNL